MIPNNNLSVLPWYSSINDQNARNWWAYGKVYPLYTPQGYLLPFQIIRNHRANSVTTFNLYTCGGSLVGSFLQSILDGGLTIKSNVNNYDLIIFGGLFPIFTNLPIGYYYAELGDGEETWYSDVFCISDKTSGFLKLSWWDESDFIMDAGAIVYTYANNARFKNFLYIDSSIAKPTYEFTEEGEERNGYFFPTKQISKKVFKFNFLAPEYMLDVLRFVRMSDYVEIEQSSKKYSIDTFQIDSTWEGDGDIASVDAEFTTATVAKKSGVGYIKAQRGDFNDDFNNDYNNQ